jgi:SAM-dependent methyltransferase
MKSFRQLIKLRRMYSHNLLNRDRWMAQQARLLQPGAAVLDGGAGSCPCRRRFFHCSCKTRDFTALSGGQLRNGAYGQIDYVSDARKIPVPDQTFDAVVCTGMPEHVPEPVEVIKESSRILKPGGKAIIAAPLGSGIHQEPCHFYGGFTPWWYEKFLSGAGFADIVVEPERRFTVGYHVTAVKR